MIHPHDHSDTDDFSPEVDKLAQQLILIFQQHFQEARKIEPELATVKATFQGWAIQKIAGLQISVMHLATQLNRLSGNSMN